MHFQHQPPIIFFMRGRCSLNMFSYYAFRQQAIGVDHALHEAGAQLAQGGFGQSMRLCAVQQGGCNIFVQVIGEILFRGIVP